MFFQIYAAHLMAKQFLMKCADKALCVNHETSIGHAKTSLCRL